MSKVVIDGFLNIREAEEFCYWYSNQGEQDSAEWFSIVHEVNKSIRDWIGCSNIDANVQSNTVYMTIGD